MKKNTKKGKIFFLNGEPLSLAGRGRNTGSARRASGFCLGLFMKGVSLWLCKVGGYVLYIIDEDAQSFA